MSNSIRSLAAALMLAAGSTLAAAQAISPAFTYQGELSGQGAPASGTFDLRFFLFDAPSGGAQMGSTLCVNNVDVVNGHFTVLLDFGNQFTSGQRYLAIEVRADDTGIPCVNPNGFMLLEPRQPDAGDPLEPVRDVREQAGVARSVPAADQRYRLAQVGVAAGADHQQGAGTGQVV